ANGHVQTRTGNRDPIAAPHGAYRCADDGESVASPDRWVAIACRSDEHWSALVDVLCHDAAAQDRRFETRAGRKAEEDELDALVSTWTAGWRAEDLATTLQARGVPAAVVENAQDLLDRDEHSLERGYYVYLDHPET